MIDKRKHRGAHPEDSRLFAERQIPRLCLAHRDLCWLLSRGYAARSSLELVGNRHDLVQRQRVAVLRCACSDAELESRRQRRLEPEDLEGEAVEIDGYNLLTTVEAALSGGVILEGRDSAYRDMASLHGTYRKVEETLPALELIGRTLATAGIDSVTWYLDRPVSNSGRLREAMREVSTREGWSWRVELVPDPDRTLIDRRLVVISADSRVLDGCRAWINLARKVVEEHVPGAWVVSLAF